MTRKKEVIKLLVQLTKENVRALSRIHDMLDDIDKGKISKPPRNWIKELETINELHKLILGEEETLETCLKFYMEKISSQVSDGSEMVN